MVINLKNLFFTDGASIDLDRALDFSDVGYNSGYPFTEPVSVSGKIFNRSGIVRISATAGHTFSAPCDRCGEPAELHRECPINHVLVFEQNTDSDDFLLVPDMQLDLHDLVLSDVLLSLPFKHLCQKDCKGVCPGCGCNRNAEDCECFPEEEDDD